MSQQTQIQDIIMFPFTLGILWSLFQSHPQGTQDSPLGAEREQKRKPSDREQKDWQGAGTEQKRKLSGRDLAGSKNINCLAGS